MAVISPRAMLLKHLFYCLGSFFCLLSLIINVFFFLYNSCFTPASVQRSQSTGWSTGKAWDRARRLPSPEPPGSFSSVLLSRIRHDIDRIRIQPLRKTVSDPIPGKYTGVNRFRNPASEKTTAKGKEICNCKIRFT